MSKSSREGHAWACPSLFGSRRRACAALDLEDYAREKYRDTQAPIHRFLDREKAARFLAQPKDYGKPWFGQLMAGPQMLAYFLQVNAWMEDYGL